MNWIIVIIGSAGLLLSGQADAQENSALLPIGKKLAEKHCVRCHVVDPSRPFTGISSTPSFKLLVNELDDWEERFSSFYVRLPHQSIVRVEDQQTGVDSEGIHPPIHLRTDDIEALVAYAYSLLEQ
ncbi:MAG: hypothetical protein ACR2O3_02675 [Rhizobiaceae bacterium]